MTQAAILAASGSPGTTTGFKNKLINGNMTIDQRNNGGSVTQNTSTQYVVDRFGVYGSTTSKCTAQQNAGSVTAPAGFVNYLGVTSSSAYSVVSADTFFLTQRIEGYNTADLNWGSANAKTITLSFWVRSSLTGTFGGSLINNDYTRSYPFTYTISAANTWQQISITIAGDTTGTWNTGSSVGIRVNWNLGSGATYSGTANTWASAEYYAPTGAVSVVGTNGATFYITGAQFEIGTTATNFDFRSYGTELGLCQRYFVKGPGNTLYIARGYAAEGYPYYKFPVTMRAAPTATYTATNISDTGGVVVSTGEIFGYIQSSWAGSPGFSSMSFSAEL